VFASETLLYFKLYPFLWLAKELMQVLEFIVCLLPSPPYYTAETFGDSCVDSFEQTVVKTEKNTKSVLGYQNLLQ
jgi:hypothetical protein